MTDLKIVSQNGQLVADSREVAKNFNKEHKNVLRDIEGLLKIEPTPNMFFESTYVHPQNNQTYKMYYMNRDGFTLLAMGFTGDKAVTFKLKYINEFNRMEEELKKDQIDTSALSPQLQMFNQMYQALANTEIKQKEHDHRLTVVEGRLDKTADILGMHPTEWRKKVTKLLNKIATERGGFGEFRTVKIESYQLLEDRARCSLSTRLTNKRRKMALEGVAKSKIDKVNNMDVIAEDARLTEIYIAVVKEIAIKHEIDPKEAM